MSTSTLPVVGIHPDLSFRDYKALPAWGSSALRAMRRGPPARVKWEREHPSQDTDATSLGSAVHCRFLTPQLYAGQYIAKPDGMEFRSAENKKWRDEHLAAGRTILTADRVSLVSSIFDALKAKPQVAEAIEGAAGCEVSLVWTDEETGEACKGRLDFVDSEYVYDLKVSRHADGASLEYRAYVEGWMHQAAHYFNGAMTLGMNLRGARLVVVSPKAPHFVHCLQIKPGAIDLCVLDNATALASLKSCRESGEWPGTPDQWVYVEPPAFALGEASVTFSGIEEE